MDQAAWNTCTDPRAMLELLQGRASERKLRLFACACCRSIWPLLTDVWSQEGVEVAERHADGNATEQELLTARVNAREASVEAIHAEYNAEAKYDFSLAPGYCRVLAEREACFAAEAATAPAGEVLHGQAAFEWAAVATSWDRENWDPSVEEEAYRAALAADSDRSSTALEVVRRAREAAREVARERAFGAALVVQAALLRDLFGNLFCRVALPPTWLTAAVISLAEAAYANRHLPSGHLDPTRLAVLADALEDAGCTVEEVLGHLRGPGPHVRGCWLIDLLTRRGR